MKQTNTVKEGRVSTHWGPLAYDVTFAIVKSVADVLDAMQRADDIRLGR